MPDDRPDLPPQDGLGGPGHPRLGYVGGPAGEEALVGRLDVRVRPDDRGRPAVEIAPQRDLLRCRFGVDIHHDQGRPAAQRFDLPRGGPERALGGLHEDAPHDVDDPERRAARERDCDAPPSRRPLGIVRGSEEPLLPPHDLEDRLVPPDMIPRGEHVHPGVDELLDYPRRHAGSPGGVLGVGDDAVDAAALPKAGDDGPDRVPPRFSDDIPAEQDRDHAPSRRIRRRPFGLTSRTPPPVSPAPPQPLSDRGTRAPPGSSL